MSRLLPIRPDLERLKGEAKSLLRARVNGDASACPVFRRLRRFSQAEDSQVLPATVTLTEAQFSLAREHGFKSWDELRKVVLGSRPITTSDVPPGKSGNRFARAFEWKKGMLYLTPRACVWFPPSHNMQDLPKTPPRRKLPPHESCFIDSVCWYFIIT